MQRVARVHRLAVARSGVVALDQFEAGSLDQAQHFAALAQAEVFGEVGEDQPAFATRRQMILQSGEKPLSMRLSGS